MPIDYCSLLHASYGLEAKKLGNTPGGQLAQCTDGKSYVIKQSKITPEKIICAHVAATHLQCNAFPEAQGLILATDGLPYAVHLGNVYTVARSINGRECSLEATEDLAEASRLLARLHVAANGFTKERAEALTAPFTELIYRDQSDTADGSVPAAEDVTVNTEKHIFFKCDLGKTPDIFKKRLGELRRFRKLASKRKDRFDFAYSAIADYYCALADRLCEELNKTAYNEIAAHYGKEGCLCHREYTAHNILLRDTDNTPVAAAVLGFDSVCIDMPVYDLANFIRRRMRKCGWSVADAEEIVRQYDSVKTLSSDEKDVLRLLLQFPQKLWRITNKYYNSRRVWCEKSCLAKLEEVKNEKEPLEAFAKSFLL